MSDSAAGLASLVLEQVARLLQRLEPARLRDLAEGRAELAVAPVPRVPAQPERAVDRAETSPTVSTGPTVATVRTGGGAAARRPRQPVDVDAARAEIMAMSSRDEAVQYVETLGTMTALRSLADGLGVRLASRDRKKADIARKIVDATLGVELTARAIRGE